MGYMFEKQDLFILLLPIWVIFRLVYLLLRRKNKETIFVIREIIINLLFVYILCVISVTLFPLWIDFNRRFVSYNIIPIKETVKDLLDINKEPSMRNFMIKFWIMEIIGNAVLFIPLAVTLPVLWKRFRNLKCTVVCVFFVSLSIETLQLLSAFIGNARSFDVDDIILNTLGAFIGYAIYKKIIANIKFIKEGKAEKSNY